MTTTESTEAAPREPQPTPMSVVQLDQMQKALERGEATSLSRTITDIIRYRSTWWLYDRDGWVPVDNEQLVARLDAAARDMAIADHRAVTEP
jgi:hypothetical protein